MTGYPAAAMALACTRFANESRQLTNLPNQQITNRQVAKSPNSPNYRRSHPVLDERHQVDELRLGLSTGLRPLQHDRTERARRDDGGSTGVLELLEAHVAD